MVSAGLKFLATLFAVWIFAVASQAQSETLLDPVTLETFSVPHPAFSDVVTSSATFQGNTRTVVTTMANAVALGNGDGMILKSYFNDDTLLVYCLGTAEVPNFPIPPGQVRLIRMSTRQVIGSGSGVVSGATVTMTVSNLVASPGEALPNNMVALESTESVYVDSSTLVSRGQVIFDWLMGSTFWSSSRPLMSEKFGLYDGTYGVQTQVRQRHRIRRDRRWTVPPGNGLPMPGDVDGDGRIDWKAGNDTVLGGGVTVGGWVSDHDPDGSNGDSMVLVIGHDDNNNGVLELGEITHIIGKCVFVPGMNIVWYEVIEGGYVIHLDNFKDLNGNGRWDPGEERRHYIYNTVTGKFKVFDEDNNLLYSGPPQGYWGQ